jgi:hypothetical protein
MAAVAFDTHRIVQRLRASGFDERQAETVTDVLIETRSAELGDLATKTDIADLKAATKTDSADLKAATKTDIADLMAATSDLKPRSRAWTTGSPCSNRA